MDSIITISDGAIAQALSELFEGEGIPLEKLTLVTELTVDGASDLGDLEQVENLTRLQLFDCRCASFGPLSKLKKLKVLSMEECPLESLTFLQELTGLEELTLSQCNVTDLTPLSDLHNLKKLDLSWNRISDLSPLKPLVQLREVDVSFNPIEAIAPLLHKPKLKKLDLSPETLRDKGLLSDKSLFPALQCPADFPEAFPREWARQQAKKDRKPRITILSELHSRVHFCKNAVLISLKDGMNRMVSRRDVSPTARDHRYDLFCDEKELVHFSVDPCPTCASFLHNGYGDGIMSLAECQAVGDRINGPYAGIRDAVGNMAPILGLFPTGLYVVAEFDLFPWHSDFFWNGSERVSQKFSCNNCRTANNPEISYTDAPLYLYPSQRAEHLNPKRVEEYLSMLSEGPSFPRAIAMYLVGDMALLLDGHHKATAAALAGKPVKSLVIFRVDAARELLAEVSAGTRLYLRHGKSIRQQGDLHIAKKGDGVLGVMRGMEHWEKERVFADAAETRPGWGRIPDACQGSEASYPSESLLYYGTLIPPDRIKEAFSLVSGNQNPDPQILHCLQAFAKLFPDSKFLSEEQRKWLNNTGKRYG